MSDFSTTSKERVSPTRLMRYDTIVRLTQFRYSGGVPDEAESARFVREWEQTCGTHAERGVLYRELCVQVPEWSQMAVKEMDNPIDAAFVEYLVAEPELDLTTIAALPAEVCESYQVIQDLHTVAFRFVKNDEAKPTSTLMFNLFEIDGPPGMEQGFLMDWPPRGEYKINEEATISTVLHQRMLPAANIKAFNRAEITSPQAYADEIDRFEAAFPRGARKAAAGPLPAGAKPPIRSHLGLFRIAASSPHSESFSRETMLAVVVEEYGGPEVLKVQRLSRPEPGPGQIRVKMKGSSINPLDVKMRSGEVRHIYPSWFPDVLGYSVAGIVDALGEGVTGRKLGEEVYGINNPIMRHAYAEYVVGPAPFFYPKPKSMGWATAAAAPSIFATAYGGLFLRANLQAGQTVLIHGGSGVIGSCAVQLAKQVGAVVIATASTKNVDWVKKLGADVVVDYKTQRFEDFASNLDVVFDTVGGETRDRSWGLIKKGGVLASLLPPTPDQETAEKYGVRAFMVHGHPNIVEIMPEMTRRLEVGELAFPEVAATYTLAQAAEAHAAFERSSPKGRIVLIA